MYFFSEQEQHITFGNCNVTFKIKKGMFIPKKLLTGKQGR